MNNEHQHKMTTLLLIAEHSHQHVENGHMHSASRRQVVPNWPYDGIER